MFAKALSTVTTEKGAKSHGSTGSSRVDFFFKVLRSTPTADLHRMLAGAYTESSQDAEKLTFHLRDCRGGKGERKAFEESLRWFINSGRQQFVVSHLKYIPFYGYWKDLNKLFGTAVESYVVDLYAEVLRMDMERLLRAKGQTPEGQDLNVSVSLAAKWAPSEKSKTDRMFGAAKKIATRLGVNLKKYRHDFLTPLRAHIGVVEKFMCEKQWDQIKYGQVPSVCMMKHRKAFVRNDADRFAAYLESVKRGEEKINASQLFPHELASSYISKKLPFDATINAQWDALVQFYRAKGTLKNAVAVCDVSGSMFCAMGQKTGYQVIDASIGMSMLIAECVAEPFRNQVITFSSTPRFHQITGTTLHDKCQSIIHSDWGMTTNFQAVFDMILDKAVNYQFVDSDGVHHVGLAVEDMPATIFVFSDMQFDQARYCPEHQKSTSWGISGSCTCTSNQLTNLEAIRMKYRKAGYPIPQLVFWNLRGDTPDFPATSDESGVALVSGYSPALMKLFMTGVSLNPYNIMREAIDDSRYDLIGNKSEKSLQELYYGTAGQTANGDEIKVIKLE